MPGVHATIGLDEAGMKRSAEVELAVALVSRVTNDYAARWMAGKAGGALLASGSLKPSRNSGSVGVYMES